MVQFWNTTSLKEHATKKFGSRLFSIAFDFESVGVEHDDSVRVCNFKVVLLGGVMYIFENVLQFTNKGGL